MLTTAKRALRRAIEAQGYFIRPRTQFGFSLGDDLKRILGARETPRIFDVGANAGQWLRAIKTTFPAARVHCYEPDARAFALLQETARPFSDVECIQSALGAEAGTMKFFRNADSVTSSLLQPTAQTEKLPYADKLTAVDAVDVDVRTVAGELTRLGIDRIDLLKTDCQGFDLRVLEGASTLIDRGAVELISTESLFQPEYEGQAWFHEILAWLSARGFAFVGLYDVLHDESGRALFGDALFARR